MQVTPFAYHLCAIDVVVRHVHPSCIGNLSVYDNNLAVVTAPHMIDSRETDGVELMDFYAHGAYVLQMPFAEWTVVGVVAETIEERPYLDALFCLVAQQMKQQAGNGIIAKIEIFQMYAASSLSDGFEQVVELLLTVHEQRHAVVM